MSPNKYHEQGGIVGAAAEQLYRDLENINVDFNLMVSQKVGESVLKVARSMSCPPVNISTSLLSTIGSCMGSARVMKSDTHSEPVLIWTCSLGMKGSGKSNVFEYVTNPILEVEDEETKRAQRESRYAEGGQPVAKKSKMENQGHGQERDGRPFNKDSYQRMLVNSTYAGLEDLLVSKVDHNKSPSVLYANDEVGSLLSALDKDPTFDSNFLSLYTAKFIRSNLRSHGYIDIKNPRVNVLGFTQPETLLKFWKLSDGDSGGKFERFIFAAPSKVRKDMRAEASVNMSEVVPLKKVVQLIVAFHDEQEQIYTLSKDASELFYRLVDEKQEYLFQNFKYDSHASGLFGKSISKVLRCSAVVEVLETAYKYTAENAENDDFMETGVQVLQEALEVSEQSIKIAHEIVQYSDKIAELLHNFTHKIVTPKKPQGWASDLNNFDISDQKILSFSKLIISIYKDTPRTIFPHNVLVKDICAKDFFPSSPPHVRTKTLKMERCLYFLQLLEKKGLLSLSKDHTYVKLLSVADEDEVKQNELLAQLRTKGLKLIGEWDDLDQTKDSVKEGPKDEENED